MLERDHELTMLALRQGGCFSRPQALDAGANDQYLIRRVAKATLERPAPGVYRLAGYPADWRSRLWATHLQLGLYSHISHEAAAHHWDMPGAPEAPVVFTVPRFSHPRPADGVVHQLADVVPADLRRVEGLPPITTPSRTIADLAAVADTEVVVGAIEHALIRSLTTVPLLSLLLHRLDRPMKPGMDRLREAIDRVAGAPPGSSELERILLRTIRAAGLPEPVLQMRLPGRPRRLGLVDAAYRLERVIIEADGRRWHARHADMAEDRSRDLAAASAGWLTIRVMYEHLVADPAGTMGRIAATLAQRRPQAS